MLEPLTVSSGLRDEGLGTTDEGADGGALSDQRHIPFPPAIPAPPRSSAPAPALLHPTLLLLGKVSHNVTVLHLGQMLEKAEPPALPGEQNPHAGGRAG
ncbi:cell cycle and apoptosis regulator protein 2 isoform X2 [Phaenicophaeus curvirostris]|uniref:cell cycle and apoptosis regulator protein 2 isoform X2 n=1 Tax=Phaenicophaeus curvirostris TaxID=33595 RepID=UPI0037F0EE58